MKLTGFLLTVVLLQASASGLSQTVTLSLENASIEKAFLEIRKQTGYVFIYSKETIKDAKAVSVKVENELLDKVLTLCFKGQPFTYALEKNYIVLKAIERHSSNLSPLPIDVKGKVLDEHGEVVIGVTITIKGSGVSTRSDSNGEFEIKSVDQDAVLIFSHVNMETFELKISGNKQLVVGLKTKISELSNVEVVSTGYQDIPKERATGSFYKVDNELLNRRISPDIISRLENVTSGFQVYRNQLSIRGRSTIFANQDPLIVVDNFPYDGDINNLNPNDIESISVLKDASAASIWGAFSGNGVIVINTKSGKYNQPTSVSLNSNVTIGNKPDLFYNPDFLSSASFIEVEKFLFDKGFYDATLNNSFDYPSVSPVVEILAKQRSGAISPIDAATQINALNGVDVRNGISRHFYQKSINQQYVLNVSGGSPRAHYYMSAGYDNIRSILVGNKMDRVTVNMQSTFRPLNNLELSGGINFIQAAQRTDNTLVQSTNGVARGHNIYPYAKFQEANGDPLAIPMAFSTSYTEAMKAQGLLDWNFYPLNELGLNNNSSQTNDTRLNAGIKYTILKGLSIDLKYQYLRSHGESKELFYEESYYVRDLVNRFTVINSDGSLKTNIPYGAVLNNFYSTLISNSARAQLSFDRTFDNHAITAIAGVDIREAKSNSNGSGLYGYDINTLTSASVNYDTLYSTLPSGSGTRVPRAGYVRGTLNRFRSYFANAAYTFSSRYTLSLSGRIDQSNFFGYKANQRTVPLWSTGVKWDISKERFFKTNFLQYLSIRTTYGFSGNLDKTATPLTLANYSVLPGGVANLPYATINSPGNPGLTWEKIGMWNIGVDFTIARGWLSGSFEYFIKSGKDMIGDEPIDPTTGFLIATGNFTDMNGKGFDIVLNSKNIDRKFKWFSTFLLSRATNKVSKYKGLYSRVTIVEGKPVEALFVNRWGGLDPATGDPQGYLKESLSKDWGTINLLPASEKIFAGSYVPTLFGSLLNSFSFGNVSLSLNLSYKANYSFLRSSINYNLLFQTWNGHKDYHSRWQKAGDEAVTNIPSMTYPSNSARDYFYSNSEILIERGDHIRFEDVRVSYTVEKSTWKALPVSNVVAYAYISNLGVIWKANDLGLDPSYTSDYLPPRSYSIGIKATF